MQAVAVTHLTADTNRVENAVPQFSSVFGGFLMRQYQVVLAAGLTGLLLASSANAKPSLSGALRRVVRELPVPPSNPTDAIVNSSPDNNSAPNSNSADPALVEQTANDAYTARRVVDYGTDTVLPDKNDTIMARFLMKSIQGCLDGVAKLEQTAPNIRLDINGVGPTSLAVTKSKYCQPALAAVKPLAGAAYSAEAAQFQGLSEKRKQVIQTYGLDFEGIKGPGKVALGTNAQKQKAPCWFYQFHEKTTSGYPFWRISKICFDANDNHRISNTSGNGVEAPASAYR